MSSSTATAPSPSAVPQSVPTRERPADLWTTTVDHKRIGILYIATSTLFMIVGGIQALVIRLQLAVPHAGVIDPDTYNQVFTMHGTTMIFFVVMPVLIGFANYFVPLMIGARDMAFPRLNAFSFWVFALGGVLLYYSYFDESPPDVGWFAYSPLTSYAFTRSHSPDFWSLSLLVAGVGTVGGAVNLIATIISLRAPGMSIGKLPLFVWMMLATSFLIVFAFPPLTAAQIMLLLDRHLGTHFFEPTTGGSAVLWQHLFWFFGHPEVYIMALPAFGMVSEIIPVFSRKVIFGYESVAAATVAIAFLSLAVWAHHMFATGMSIPMDDFFAGASLLIAVPTGIKVFNWVATMYHGHIILKTPMLFAIGFVSMFVIGGLTGIMLAAAPLDWQVTDTYFVVGHFHYVLFGGTLFAILAALYYWFPKMSGRMLNERMGRWHFWLMFIGFNLTFGPMHIAGILGMPRRVYTFEPGMGLEPWNMAATLGTFVLLAAFILLFVNVFWSLRRGERAGDDPWNAWTLEWATTSPPPPYDFEETPVVKSRRPLWDLKHPEDPDWKFE